MCAAPSWKECGASRDVRVKRRLVASPAVHDDADPGLPPFGRGDPRATLERRAVPHVLTVAAVEIGHPMTFVVLRETDDVTLHTRRV
jgi:hypothetical protein